MARPRPKAPKNRTAERPEADDNATGEDSQRLSAKNIILILGSAKALAKGCLVTTAVAAASVAVFIALTATGAIQAPADGASPMAPEELLSALAAMSGLLGVGCSPIARAAKKRLARRRQCHPQKARKCNSCSQGSKGQPQPCCGPAQPWD